MYDKVTSVRGRLAPTPSGRMHAGNIFSALIAWLSVKCRDGRIVLRIEDIDRARSKDEYAQALQHDLECLGLTWDEGPAFQSMRDELYREALHAVSEMTYPCFCTRAELHASSAPHEGDRAIYSKRCKSLSPERIAQFRKERAEEGRDAALRLSVPDIVVAFEDAFQGRYEQQLARGAGDYIVRRSDGAIAYQLAVVVDDALMGITEVVRGIDLLSSTPQQIHLAHILGYSAPAFGHVPLICAPDGRRLAKRDHDAYFDELMRRFGSSDALIGHLAYLAGLIDADEAISAEELRRRHDVHSLRQALLDKKRIIFA